MCEPEGLQKGTVEDVDVKVWMSWFLDEMVSIDKGENY
jgi:hypothetical protein